jgi:cytochrome c biogenesis protein CcmG/thiol:disulfide interchange protein DsbE
LEAALQAEGFSLAAFDTYLANLIAARDFSMAQAQARGITQEAYILELRQANDVRFATGDVAALSEAVAPAMSRVSTVTSETLPTDVPPTPTAVPPTPTDVPPAPTDVVPRGTEVGQRAPDFALPLLGSDPLVALDLDALLGQPVVLSFWVTWCSHCRAQTPLLVDAYTRESAAGVQFVGVNVRETADEVQRYVNAQAIPYPVVLDTEGQTAQRYQVSGYPTTYFLDAEGRVAARYIGQLNAQVLEQYLALVH